MSEYHVFCCDRCGYDVQYADNLPRGWERHGGEDWCVDCLANEARPARGACYDTPSPPSS